MNWRWLIPFPLAAFLCGEAVRAPRLKPELAESALGCPGYTQARASYLLAYGYRRENPAKAVKLVLSAIASVKDCPGPAAERLRHRGEDLKTSLGESL